MPPPPRSRRKQQSRLTFTPLSSTSPAAKEYNKQIRDRAAAVTLDAFSSPSKRRKIQSSESKPNKPRFDSTDDEVSLIPTPEASSQPAGNYIEDQSDGESIRIPSRSFQTKAKLRQKQQRLDFDRVRDPSSFDASIRLDSPLRTQKNNSMFSSPLRRTVVHISSDESDDQSSQASPSPVKLGTRSKEKLRRRGTHHSAGQTQRATGSWRQSSIAESDDEDVIAITNSEKAPGDVEDSESDMPTTLGTQRRRGRQSSRNSSFVDDAPVIDSDSEGVTVVKSRSRKLPSDHNEDEDEDDEPVTPKRRKLVSQRKLSQREKDELAEDLDFLAPSSDGDDADGSMWKPRSTQSAQKSARALALERLKRRRSGNETRDAGENRVLGAGSGDGRNEIDGVYDDDDYNDNDNDDNGGSDPSQFPSSRQMFNEDEDDADFLVDEDDGGLLGVPDGVPLEFTRFASMKPKELFKYAAEWFVQRKINPAYQSNDEIYTLTFKKLDDEVKGLAGSKFTSSAWTADFTLALQARPEIAYETIDRSSAEHWMRDKCDACNRSSHPATYQIQFQGVPYHPESLEEVPQHGEEEDESDDAESSASESNEQDDDRSAWDAQGRQIPAANGIYYVGKFCMSNARTAHALNHWRYHLNQWVETWLIRQGYCKPERLVERDGWKTKKRRRYANKIVDRMEKEGVIKSLYRDFRNNIDEARNSKQGRYTNGVDSP